MRHLISSLATSFTISAAAGALPQYRVNDLAVPVETFPYNIDINDYGQIVGSTFAGPPFLWTPTSPGGIYGIYTPLETLPGISHFAAGINERGQITGTTSTGSTNVALLWQPTVPNGTPGAPVPLFPGFGFPNSINDSGQVAGEAIVNGRGSAFLFKPQIPNGSIGAVFSPVVGGKGFNLNDRGQIAGVNAQGVVLWQPTTPNALTGAIVPIGISSDSALPIRINATGQIAGDGAATGAFLWNPATPNGSTGVTSLIPRIANLNIVEVHDLSDSGQVLGTSYGDADSTFRPWIWSINDGLVDLNQLLIPEDVGAGWRIERSGAINNNGYIVALATLTPPGGTQLHKTVLLTPVPEPMSLPWIALAALWLRRQRSLGCVKSISSPARHCLVQVTAFPRMNA